MSPIDVAFAIPQDQVQSVQERLGTGAVLPALALDRSRQRVLDTGRFWALDNQVDTSTGTPGCRRPASPSAARRP